MPLAPTAGHAPHMLRRRMPPPLSHSRFASLSLLLLLDLFMRASFFFCFEHK
jgi:hypothetical protein